MLFRQSEADLFTPPARQESMPGEELMFGNSTGPIVGSYSPIGRFATDEEFLVFVE
jgi:hypothetical protein